ncbi:MAG: flavodoxin [Bacteroidales bacterium]|nr:flavodoxin [Bacteroidales bacterium]MCF8387841.1 flavodoxin [Bacteroidales bacterium]MCF8397111.1 flavodoxin [Bacteroidales bacterium]
MRKIGIIYWPKGGNVESVAERIFNQFDKSYTDLFDASEISATDIVNYDFLIIGGSTTGSETWHDVAKTNKWNDILGKLDDINLENKIVAVFGLGDQILWPGNFVDSMIELRDEFEKRGARIVGEWPTTGYKFTDSRSVVDGKFVGLAIDEDQQAELTNNRIQRWTDQIKKEFGLQ